MNLHSLLIMTLALLMTSTSWSAQATESEIKATYLYNFAKFADWPPSKISGSGPLAICLFNKDPFGGVLQQLAKGKTVKNHPIEVRILNSLDFIKSCHILFVSDNAVEKSTQLMEQAQSFNVLSVGEASNFIAQGGQIQFFIQEASVRFEINLNAVQQAGITIDARVLNIAKIRR